MLAKTDVVDVTQMVKKVQSPQNSFFIYQMAFLFVLHDVMYFRVPYCFVPEGILGILSYLILSYPILSYPTLSYPTLSYPILPYLSSKFYIARTPVIRVFAR